MKLSVDHTAAVGAYNYRSIKSETHSEVTIVNGI